jgi:hypothetical protein
MRTRLQNDDAALTSSALGEDDGVPEDENYESREDE